MDKEGSLLAYGVITPNIIQINTMQIDMSDFFSKPRRIAILISDLCLGSPDMVTRQEAFKQMLLDSFQKGGSLQKVKYLLDATNKSNAGRGPY